MKVFSILSLLLITSCGLHIGIESTPYEKPSEKYEPAPETATIDHKVNECFLFIDNESEREEWEIGESNVYVKIMKVGKNKYLVKGFQKGYKVSVIGVDKDLLEKNKPIICPKELK